jgi:putative DNA primase/helicase
MTVDVDRGVERDQKYEDALSQAEAEYGIDPEAGKAEIKAAVETEVEGFRLTDLGNAERLVRVAGKHLRYRHDGRTWHVWDGTRWGVDRDGGAVRAAKRTVRSLYGQANDEAVSDEDAKKLAAWAHVSSGAARIDAMLKLAQSDTAVTVKRDDFDVEPWELNARNGIVDLRTGKLRAHDPKAMHSQIVSASYDPDAEAPKWEAFLRQVLPNDATREHVHKLVGYSASGEIGERLFPFAYGSGANGKSVFLNVLRDVLGEYAGEAAPDLLAARRERGVPTDIADLQGLRFVTTSEVEAGRALATDLMKRISGDDTLKARRMRQDFEGFRNVSHIWMAANDRPKVDGSDQAIWDRIHAIPFTVTIPEEDRNPDLARDLREERDGILTWVVWGAVKYHEAKAQTGQGLKRPPQVMEAVDDYRAESNPLREWFAADCVGPGDDDADDDAWEPTARLRQSYEAFSRIARVDAIPKGKKWAESLERLGLEPRTAKNVRGWAGVRLRDRHGV